jgi:hypothetical protein
MPQAYDDQNLRAGATSQTRSYQCLFAVSGALLYNPLGLERSLFSGIAFFSCDLSFGAQPMFSILSLRATLFFPDSIGSLTDSMFSPIRHFIPSRLVVTAHSYSSIAYLRDRIDLDQASRSNSEDLFL